MYLLKPLLFTISIELIISIVLGIRKPKEVFVIICTNVLTNIFTNYISHNFVFNCSLWISGSYGIDLQIILKLFEYSLEIFIVILEFIVFNKFLCIREIIISKLVKNKMLVALILSIVLNSASYFIYKLI